MIFLKYLSIELNTKSYCGISRDILLIVSHNDFVNSI